MLLDWLDVLLSIFYLFYNNCLFDASRFASLFIGDLLAMFAIEANLGFFKVPRGLIIVFFTPSSRWEIINSSNNNNKRRLSHIIAYRKNTSKL